MNPKQKSLFVGALIGALLGALAGYLFARGLESSGDEETRALTLRSAPPGELVKIFIAILGVLRGITELGERL